MEFVLPQGIFGWNIIGSICRHPVSREGHISAVFIWGVWVCWESLAVGHSLYLWLCCRQQQGTIVYICDCVADDSSGPLFISVTVLQTTAADRCLNLWLYCRRQQRTMVYKTTAADCSLYLWLCCRRHQLTMWTWASASLPIFGQKVAWGRLATLQKKFILDSTSPSTHQHQEQDCFNASVRTELRCCRPFTETESLLEAKFDRTLLVHSSLLTIRSYRTGTWA